MPEVILHIRWPDGHEERCCLPSTIIGQHLMAGQSDPLPEFLTRARAGLNAASDRVAAKYGQPCTSAIAQLARIEATARLHAMSRYAITIEQHPDPTKALTQTNHDMSGRDGGKDIDLRRFARDGEHLNGSMSGAQARQITFLPDLERNLDDADRSYCGIRDQIVAQAASTPASSAAA